MKHTFKKILAIIIACTMIFAINISYVNAAEVTPRIDFVARIRVVSFAGGGPLSSVGYNGHSFIVVENTSNTSITVGHMPVAAGDSVTLGTFGNRSAHVGIWYNIEGCLGYTSPAYSLSTYLTLGELAQVNIVINNNDHWTYTDNCSGFAVDVWNATPSPYTISGGNPAAVVNSIKSKSSYVQNPTIPSKASSTIARHTSTSYVFDSSGLYSD